MWMASFLAELMHFEHPVLIIYKKLLHRQLDMLRLVMLPSLFHEIKESDLLCEVCFLANSHRRSFSPSMNKRLFPFDLVHFDVWGPSPISTISGIKWFVAFVDDCTRMTWMYVMTNKSDVSMVFRSFSQMITTQYSFVIKVLRSNNEVNILVKNCLLFFRIKGSSMKLLVLILHNQIRLLRERIVISWKLLNHYILETARDLFIGAFVPKRFWPEAVTYAVYVINHMPSQVVEFRTPLQVLTENFP